MKIRFLTDTKATTPGLAQLVAKKGDEKVVDDRVGRHLVAMKKAEKVEESDPEHAAD